MEVSSKHRNQVLVIVYRWKVLKGLKGVTVLDVPVLMSLRATTGFFIIQITVGCHHSFKRRKTSTLFSAKRVYFIHFINHAHGGSFHLINHAHGGNVKAGTTVNLTTCKIHVSTKTNSNCNPIMSLSNLVTPSIIIPYHPNRSAPNICYGELSRPLMRASAPIKFLAFIVVGGSRSIHCAGAPTKRHS